MGLDTLYLIHHTHTDIGYTYDQPIFWEMQARFIDDALNLIDHYADKHPADSAFRWTVETTCGLEAWLRTASAKDIDRLVRAEKAGWLEVTAMFANITPLYDLPQLVEALRPVQRLRADYGLDIRYAMNCDVNGQNWTLADALLDAGIEGFSMAINHHFGGPPTPRPNVFRWEAPSGRHLLAHNGWQYSKAGDFGLGDDTDERFVEWLPKIQRYLDEIGYPLTALVLEGFHPFGDNGSAWGAYAEFAQRWNASGRAPRLVVATPRMFWAHVQAQAGALSTLRGDWTDYWNFGCISAARETAIARAARSRLGRADALFALGAAAAQAGGAAPAGRVNTRWAERSFRLYRDEAWRALNLYGEHTWGADSAATQPWLEDSLSMANHKNHLAYTARSLSLLLERDALAELAQRVTRDDPGDMLVANLLPWERVIAGPIGRHVAVPRGLPDDATSGRHFQDRFRPPTDFWTGRAESDYNGQVGFLLPPTRVPALGYTVVAWSDLAQMANADAGEDATIENHRYRLAFDCERGGLTSLYDKTLGCEWVEPRAAYPWHGFVHETVADRTHPAPRRLLFEMDWAPVPETLRGWKPGWPAERTPPTRVLQHRVYRLPFATIVEQVLEHPAVGRLCQRVLLPNYADHLECESEWQMGVTTHPEATYLLFPFNLPQAQARFDVGGVSVRPELDQLPGVCRDYFTVQGWVDFSNGERGVTVATPDNPLVQLGGFHFAHNQSEFRLEQATLLGWVTNNYWETNFPGYQPGTVQARYHILPYGGAFSEARAHRFAAEAAHARPLVQHLGEPAQPCLPATASLLNLPPPPVLVLGLKGAEAGGLSLVLYNASDEPQTAALSSPSVPFHEAARCDVFGQPQTALEVTHGAIELTLAPRRLTTLTIRLAPGSSQCP